MEKDMLIASFQKNALETVKIKLVEYKGKELIDIRAWIEDKEGKEIATKKGLTISTKLLPMLKKAIKEAIEKLGN